MGYEGHILEKWEALDQGSATFINQGGGAKLHSEMHTRATTQNTASFCYIVLLLNFLSNQQKSIYWKMHCNLEAVRKFKYILKAHVHMRS